MDTSLAPSQGLDFYASGLASGRNDIFEAFLGPPAKEQKTSAYSKKSTAKWNMPENYIGESLYLRDTVEDYMLTAAWDFWTERILPWYKTDQIHMQWTEWENNPHYMGITPHQATSKVVTQRRTIRKASIIRRGIAAEFELDFVTTPLGRTSFAASIGQMSRSIQETGNVEVLRALLGCHRPQQVYIRKHGVVADNDLDGWLQRKADRFMAAQKDPFGLEILATQVEQDQEQYGGQGNVWILGREVADYCRFRDEKSLYYKGGQEAVDRVNNRSTGRSAAGNTMGNVRSLEPPGMIGDTPVYFAKSMNVDSIGKAELLSRTVEVGVYNMMVDRTRDYQKYKSEGRNLRVYDNDIDNWSDIELITAIEKCGIWTKDGAVAPIYATKKMKDASMQHDAEFDFLSFIDQKNGTRRELEHIGDMSSTYLTASNLQQAGQTLLNQLPEDAQKSLTDLFAVLKAASIKKTAGLTMAEISNTVDGLVKSLVDLVGADNEWLTAANRPDFKPVESFIGNFVTPHLVHAVQGGAVAVGASAGAAAGSADLEHKFLMEVLGAVVPDQHKVTLQKIASQTDKSWTERSQKIKELVLQCQQESPESVSALAKPTDVDKWHNKHVNDFKTRLEKKFGSSSTQSTQQVSNEVHYFAAGAEVPQGWTIVQTPSSGPLSSRMAAFRAVQVDTASASAGQRRGLIGSHLAPGARGAYSDKEKEAAEKADKVSRLDHSNLRAHVNALEKTSASAAVKILGAVYAGCKFNRDRLMSFASNHIYVPLGFLLLRPHATYKTRFGIKVAAGGQTGFTFFGHSNMQIETEAARKVGMMHYTAYLSAVVMQPKNVYVVEDLFCQKYLGGMGVEFWSPDEYKNAISRRSKSIICAPLPPNFKKIEQKIDIRGRWYTEQKMGLVSQERFDKPLYPGCGRMNVLFGMSDKMNKQTGARKVAMNTVCWQGYFNVQTQQFDDFTVESGNFGPKVYPGCGAVRNGQMKYLQDPGYQRARH